MSYNREKKSHKWIRGYLREIADLLWLRDWTIEIESDEPESSEAIAAIRPIWGRRRALIRFRDDFWNMDSEDQRQTIVHELIHCHFAESLHWAREVMKARPHGAYLLMHETSVDALADAIASLLPLPTKTVSGKTKK